jgi:hypothetical protein
MGADRGFSLTSLLATYGALVSSLMLGWTLYRDLRDRRKVKFSVEIRRIGIRSDGAFFSIAPNSGIEGASEEVFFIFSMVNVGRRPVRLKNIYAKYKEPVNGKRGLVFSARDLPKSLDEQEALDEYSEFDERFVSENVESITVSDVSGKQWRLSRKQMRELRTDAKQFLGEKPPAGRTHP